MEGSGILYAHLVYLYCYLVYFVAIYILWPFGISFPRFGESYQEKSGNPATRTINIVACPLKWNRWTKDVR
jgi:hypothetical protein